MSESDSHVRRWQDMLSDDALQTRVAALELTIVRARREFRKGGDPIDCRAWLFRIEIDESKYPEFPEG
jgi:hypothetical protein